MEGGPASSEAGGKALARVVGRLSPDGEPAKTKTRPGIHDDLVVVHFVNSMAETLALSIKPFDGHSRSLAVRRGRSG